MVPTKKKTNPGFCVSSKKNKLNRRKGSEKHTTWSFLRVHFHPKCIQTKPIVFHGSRISFNEHEVFWKLTLELGNKEDLQMKNKSNVRMGEFPVPDSRYMGKQRCIKFTQGVKNSKKMMSLIQVMLPQRAEVFKTQF